MSFEPVAAPDAHVLIVGTWPSPKSREQGFYYGHPQNRFWPLLARLLEQPVPRTIPEKKALIVGGGLVYQPQRRPVPRQAQGIRVSVKTARHVLRGCFPGARLLIEVDPESVTLCHPD